LTAPGATGDDAKRVPKPGPDGRLGLVGLVGLVGLAPTVNQDSVNWRSLPTQIP